MSGFGPLKKLPSARSDARRRRSDDPCDLQFRTDLVGVRPGAKRVAAGDFLEVELKAKGAIRSVVCISGQGDVLGTLAAFQGLAQLMRCMDQGNKYIAEVEFASRTQCTVLVYREAK